MKRHVKTTTIREDKYLNGLSLFNRFTLIVSVEFNNHTSVFKDVFINITEIKQPDLNAQLVAESIAAQLEKRVSFRRALKQSISRTMKLGAKGIKTQVSGRIGGAEIARTERYHEGTIPLQTIRADIDYGFAEAHTTYGIIGVKVWLYKGEVLHDTRKPRREGGAR